MPEVFSMTQQSRKRLTRRASLQVGALGLTGLTLSSSLRLASANEGGGAGLKGTAKSCIFVFLAGGASHLDTLDMKPEGPVETRGEFTPIDTCLPGVQACHLMPKFAKTADQYCLLRGISHSQGAHPQAESYLGTGNSPSPAVLYPSYGAVTTRELPRREDLPPYVAIPTTPWDAGYMGDAYAPFNTNDVPKPGQPYTVRGLSLENGLTIETVNRRTNLLDRINRQFYEANANSQLVDALDQFGKQAHQMMTSSHSQNAFDVGREPESIRQRFDGEELGQSLLLAARLVEHGVPFVTVTSKAHGGWDTHTDNFVGQRRLIEPLDAGMEALISTLRDKGLLDETLVVIMGEFGRSPQINENTGRDHWPRANWSLMTGGGVQTGQVIGATDDKGEGPTGDVDIAPDDIAASIYHMLGIDFRKEYYTATGRPVMLVPKGRVIPGLIGSGTVPATS